MQKTMKRTLALILAVMLCLSGLPYSAFATEAPPDEPLSSQAPPSEAPAESSQPEPSAGPDIAPQPDLEATPSPEESPEPSQDEEPSPTPEADSTPGPSAESSASPEPAATSIFETELSTVEARQVSLAGAKYGVYQGNELVKEYTTDEKGQFTTDYYPYGEDWTLREISAGEGYLVSDVSTQLCEIPAGTEDEVLPYGTYTLREVSTNESMLQTFTEQTVQVREHKETYVVTAENEVVRGGLAVEKRDTITGSTPQGNADFSGITFEIINDSKNPVTPFRKCGL